MASAWRPVAAAVRGEGQAARSHPRQREVHPVAASRRPLGDHGEAVAGRARWGLAIGIAIVSHLVLDLVTHDRDIALAPLVPGEEYGTRLYNTMPAVAFLVELGFGVLCWKL